MFAAVKGELVPGKNHTSLITGLTFQLGTRNSSGSIFDTSSLFFRTVSQWWQLDQVFIVLAFASALVGLAFRRTRPMAALVVFAVAVMFRPNSYVPVPYVIMLLPFGALLIAAAGDSAVKAYRERRGRALTTTANRVGATAWLVVSAVAIAAAVPLWTVQLRGFEKADLDASMVSAESWVNDNVPHDSRLLVDDSMWVDLVKDGFARDNVIWFYKLDTDTAVEAQNPNGWKDSDYIIETDSIRTSAYAEPNIRQALANSTVVADFGTGTKEVTIRQIHPEGLAQATAQMKQEASARAQMGSELARNPNLVASTQVTTALNQGRVDARSEIVLGQLLATGKVTVSDLSTLPGESSAPYRRLVLKAAALPGSQLDAWLRAVGDSYRPSTVSTTSAGTVAVFPAVDTISTVG